jgi:putative endonuclease
MLPLPDGFVRTYHVYILASRTKRLYVGVTGNLAFRLHQHQIGKGSTFAHRYGITRLVYAEDTHDANAAIRREKELKGWVRRKKIALIESRNPRWEDLSPTGPTDPSLRSG